MTRGALLVLVGMATACSSKPPSKVQRAPTTPPDESYETDGAHAERVLIWTCIAGRNERVAMIQECAEGLTGCGPWVLDQTLCPLGGPTPNERAVLDRGRGRHPIPAGYGWR